MRTKGQWREEMDTVESWVKNKERKVTVVGGTHGNEFLGAYLVKKLEEEKYSREGLNINYELANPKAFEQGTRYVDEDLNRCFSTEYLKKAKENKGPKTYEEGLALHFYEKFKKNNVDFIIDLHTTTSNMGPTIILSHRDELSLKAADHLKKKFPELKVICDFVELEECYCLFSVAPSGLLFEFGPVPQGVLKSKQFLLMENVVKEALSFLSCLKEDDHERIDFEKGSCGYETYHVTTPVDFPRDEKGKIRGMIHPEREGLDFVPMKKGDPLFLCFDGEDLYWEGETSWPIFMNEAAYYEKSTALVLTQKRD